MSTYSAGLLNVTTLTASGASAQLTANNVIVTNLTSDTVVAGNLNLTSLEVITNLDVSGNLTAHDTLTVIGNSVLATVDVSGNITSQSLDVIGNSVLTTLDVSGNITSQSLSVSHSALVTNNIVVGSELVVAPAPQTVTPDCSGNPLSGKSFYFSDIGSYFFSGYNRYTITDNGVVLYNKPTSILSDPDPEWAPISENSRQVYNQVKTWDIKYVSNFPYQNIYTNVLGAPYQHGPFIASQPCVVIGYHQFNTIYNKNESGSFYCIDVIQLNNAGTDFYVDASGHMVFVEIILSAFVYANVFKPSLDALVNGEPFPLALFQSITCIVGVSFNVPSFPAAVPLIGANVYAGGIVKSTYGIENPDFIANAGYPYIFPPALINNIQPGPTPEENHSTTLSFNYPNDLKQWISANRTNNEFSEAGDVLANGNIIYTTVDAITIAYAQKNNTSYKQNIVSLYEYDRTLDITKTLTQYHSSAVNGSSSCTDGFLYLSDFSSKLLKADQTGNIVGKSTIWAQDLSGNNPSYFAADDIKAIQKYTDTSRTYVFFSGANNAFLNTGILKTQRQNPTYAFSNNQTGAGGAGYIGMWDVDANTVWRLYRFTSAPIVNGIEVTQDGGKLMVSISNGAIVSFNVDWTGVSSTKAPVVTKNLAASYTGTSNVIMPYPSTYNARNLPAFDSMYMYGNNVVTSIFGMSKYDSNYVLLDASWNKPTAFGFTYNDQGSNSCVIDLSNNFYTVSPYGLSILPSGFQPIETYDAQTPTDSYFIDIGLNHLANGGVQAILRSYDAYGFCQSDCVSNVGSTGWTDIDSSGGVTLLFNVIDYSGNYVASGNHLHGLASDYVGVNISNAVKTPGLAGIFGSTVVFTLKVVDASGNLTLSSSSLTLASLSPNALSGY